MVESTLNKSSERIIGIDLLKIISMVMIIALHVIGMFGLVKYPEGNAVSIICAILYFPTRCAVNCYAIASGFLSVNKKFKLSRIIYLWVQTFIYSFFIALIFKIIYPQSLSISEMFFYAFPILSAKYWYVSAYFGLFLFMPILNMGIKNLSQKSFKIILISILSVVMISSFANEIIFHSEPFTINGGMSVLWLIIMYLLGAYIKLYGINFSLKVLIPTFVLVNAINIAIYFIFEPRGINYNFIYYYDFPTVVISSLSLFLIFAKVKVEFKDKLKKCIISLSTATFGVYLIHIHPLVNEHVLTKLGFVTKHNVFVFIALLISVIFGIYLACSLIDILRAYIFKRIKIDKLCALADKPFTETEDDSQK